MKNANFPQLMLNDVSQLYFEERNEVKTGKFGTSIQINDDQNIFIDLTMSSEKFLFTKCPNPVMKSNKRRG